MTDETPAERSTRHMAERAALVADSARVAFHDRRYPLVVSKRSKSGIAIGFRYGPWQIDAATWARPLASFDWDWSHDDFDGAPDAGDHRCGAARNPDACIAEIHAWEDEQ